MDQLFSVLFYLLVAAWSFFAGMSFVKMQVSRQAARALDEAMPHLESWGDSRALGFLEGVNAVVSETTAPLWLKSPKSLI